MGLAMSHFLLKAGHKLLLVARTAAPLENLKKEYPGQVEVVAADMADFSVGVVLLLRLSERKIFSSKCWTFVNQHILTPADKQKDC